MKNQKPYEAARQVEEWNKRHAVGQEVMVFNGRNVFKTRTRSAALLAGGHTPVVCLEGMKGAFLLGRVRAVSEFKTFLGRLAMAGQLERHRFKHKAGGAAGQAAGFLAGLLALGLLIQLTKIFS